VLPEPGAGYDEHHLIHRAGQKGFAAEEGTVLEQIVGKILLLLYIPIDEVDLQSPINHYGVDSMVAAELRNWFLTTFGREIGMLKLLSATMTVHKLAEEAEEHGVISEK
jgi:hypothetical protein